MIILGTSAGVTGARSTSTGPAFTNSGDREVLHEFGSLATACFISEILSVKKTDRNTALTANFDTTFCTVPLQHFFAIVAAGLFLFRG